MLTESGHAHPAERVIGKDAHDGLFKASTDQFDELLGPTQLFKVIFVEVLQSAR
jgi:hypothetical protein